MLATSSSLSLTPLTYLAGRLSIFILALFSCRSSEVIVYLSASRDPSSAVFCCIDPCFVDLAAAFTEVFCLVFFQFEEFVDVIFPSFPRSSNRSVGPVF